MTEPVPFDVLQGEFVVKGQLTMGHAVGVRMHFDQRQVVDVIFFTANEAIGKEIAKRQMGVEMVYQAGRRCVMASESQVVIPGLDVREVGQAEWDEATRPGSL